MNIRLVINKRGAKVLIKNYINKTMRKISKKGATVRTNYLRKSINFLVHLHFNKKNSKRLLIVKNVFAVVDNRTELKNIVLVE